MAFESPRFLHRRRPWDGASSRKGPERARLSPAAPAAAAARREL